MHIGTFQDCLTQRQAACVIIRPLDGDNDVGGRGRAEQGKWEKWWEIDEKCFGQRKRQMNHKDKKTDSINTEVVFVCVYLYV